jgi:streptogramin lyase
VVPGINSSSQDTGAELADDLTLYMSSDRQGGGRGDIYVATRNTVTSSFTTPQALGLNNPYTALFPRVTSDELTLYYVFYASSSSGGDIYVTTRSSVAVAFAPGAAVAQVNQADEGDVFVWRDGQALYFVSNRAGGAGLYDIYTAVRRPDGSFATPQAVSELNTTSWESSPVVTQDGLRIYWGSKRTDGNAAGDSDVWTATRASTADPFSNLARVTELNTSYAESPSWISSDGCTIYIITTRPGGPGGQDVWQASKPPLGSTPTFAEFAVPASGVWDMAPGSDGNVWVTEATNKKIARVTPAGAVTEFPVPYAASHPSGIAAGVDGNLWFTDSGTNAIGRITTTGTVTEFSVPTASADLAQIASGPDGNLWFAEYAGSKIGRITTAGVVTEFLIPTANSGPDPIAAGPDGNLWFGEAKVGKIGRITPAGVFVELPVPSAGPGATGISGVTAGPDGNIWFLEYDANKVGRVTPAGVFTEFPILTSGSGSWRIVSGPDGNLWFTESAPNKIGRITTDGAFAEFPIPTAASNPAGMTVGPDGNIWFTEFNVNQIGRINP